MHIKQAETCSKHVDLNFTLSQNGKWTDFIFTDELDEAQKSKDTWPKSHSTVDTQTQAFWF